MKRQAWVVRRYLWAAAGAVLLGALVYWLGPRAVGDAIAEIPPGAFAALVVLQVASIFVSAAAFLALIPDLPYRAALACVGRSALLSIFGPPATGEGSLLYLLRANGIATGRALRAVILDRGVTVFTILAAAAAALWRIGLCPPEVSAAGVAVVALSGLVALGWLAPVERPRVLANLSATAVRAAIWGLFYLVAFRGAGAAAATFPDFVVFPISVSLLNILPVPGGIGVAEGGATALFAAVGVPARVTVAAYLVSRIAAFLGTALVAALPAPHRSEAGHLWEEIAEDFAARRGHPTLPEGLLAPLAADRLLDLGCGSGALLASLAPHARRLVGMDLSAALLAEVRPPANVVLARADASRCPFRPESFGSVHSYLVFCHLPEADVPRAWDEVSRLLAPGGRFLLAAPNRLSFYYPFRKALEIAGILSIGWCHHSTVRTAAADAARVGLRLVSAVAIPKPPSGSTPLRLAFARLAARLDGRVARVVPSWGGDLVLLFEKPRGST